MIGGKQVHLKVAARKRILERFAKEDRDYDKAREYQEPEYFEQKRKEEWETFSKKIREGKHKTIDLFFRTARDEALSAAVGGVFSKVVGFVWGKAWRWFRGPTKAVEAAEAAVVGKIAPKSGLSSASRLSADELATGRRLEVQLGKSLKESPHIGADYVDDLGKSYDALGGFDPKFFNESSFLHQIDKHLRKSNNFTVIDMTGFSQAQIDAVRRHLSTLSAEQLERIIKIGF